MPTKGACLYPLDSSNLNWSGVNDDNLSRVVYIYSVVVSFYSPCQLLYDEYFVCIISLKNILVYFFQGVYLPQSATRQARKILTWNLFALSKS